MTSTSAGGPGAGGDGARTDAGGTRLAGRPLRVTGAGRALGSRNAHRLAQRGARLTLHGRDGHRLDALAGEVGGAATVSADPRDPWGPARLVGRRRGARRPRRDRVRRAGERELGAAAS